VFNLVFQVTLPSHEVTTESENDAGSIQGGSASKEVTHTNTTDDSDAFVQWLRVTVGGPTKERPKVKKMKEVLVRYREFLDALENLHERGWGWSLGGFQVSEGELFFTLVALEQCNNL
jgi:hypothetical protein